MPRPEGEQVPQYSFEEIVARSVESLEKFPNGSHEGVAIAGLGYALLAYAIAFKEQRDLPPQTN